MIPSAAGYWRKRADTYEWARPRPTDYNGQSTAGDRRDRDLRLANLANACRAKADLLEEQWREVAA